MNYENFFKDFFGYLRNNDKTCLNLLEKNKKLVEANLNRESNQEIVKEFVNEINYTIHNSKGKYKLIENVLKNDSLEHVYSVFKNSEILVEACKHANVEAVNWLITMDINPCVIEKKTGMSALMYAVQNEKLLCVAEKYGKNFKCVNLEDHEGNNALYYALDNIPALTKLEEVDINHINHKHETVLMYALKKKNVPALDSLLNRTGIDVNIPDEKGKTVPIILIEDYRISEFDLLRQKHCNLDYIDEHGEGVLSTLIRKMYRKSQSASDCHYFAKAIICLVRAEVNFNVVVDEDENTALMAFLIARDYETFNFVCSFAKNLDLKKKNKYGESTSSLILKLDLPQLPQIKKKPLFRNHTFDFKYLDPTTNNTALIYTVINKPSFIEEILKFNYSSINEVNLHKESALIIAAKLNNYNSVEFLLDKNANTDLQDDTGNTALHYAIQARNIPMIYDLIKNNANIYIKNNVKETALEMAQRVGDNKILDAIHDRLSFVEYVKEKKSMKDCQNMKIPQIDEYLYTNTSCFYSEFNSNDDTQREIGSEYKVLVETVKFNEKSFQRISLNPLYTVRFVEDVIFLNDLW